MILLDPVCCIHLIFAAYLTNKRDNFGVIVLRENGQCLCEASPWNYVTADADAQALP